MPFYPDTEALYRVMRALFGRVLGESEVLEHLRHDKITLRITIEHPPAVILLDTGCQPPCYFLDGDPKAEADLGLRLDADTLHDVWLSNIRLRDAYAHGLIHLDTNPFKALGHLMRLAEVFRYLERVYPDVLREQGLL